MSIRASTFGLSIFPLHFFSKIKNIFVSLMWILTARSFQFILMKWLLMNIFHIFNIQSIDIIKMLKKFVSLQILIRKVWFSVPNFTFKWICERKWVKKFLHMNKSSRSIFSSGAQIISIKFGGFVKQCLILDVHCRVSTLPCSDTCKIQMSSNPFFLQTFAKKYDLLNSIYCKKKSSDCLEFMTETIQFDHIVDFRILTEWKVAKNCEILFLKSRAVKKHQVKPESNDQQEDEI